MPAAHGVLPYIYKPLDWSSGEIMVGPTNQMSSSKAETLKSMWR